MTGVDPARPGDRLGAAIRQARLAQADHFGAVFDIRDAKQLRLVALQDELSEAAGHWKIASELFDLTVTQGEPPRLWVDATSYVVMEPDPRTYRFVQESRDNREVLLETSNRQAIAEHVINYMAHRIVERERMLVVTPERTVAVNGYSALVLGAVWFGGMIFGVIMLLALGTMLGFLRV